MGRRKARQLVIMTGCLILMGLLLLLMTRHVCLISDHHKHCWWKKWDNLEGNDEVWVLMQKCSDIVTLLLDARENKQMISKYVCSSEKKRCPKLCVVIPCGQIELRMMWNSRNPRNRPYLKRCHFRPLWLKHVPITINIVTLSVHCCTGN